MGIGGNDVDDTDEIVFDPDDDDTDDSSFEVAMGIALCHLEWSRRDLAQLAGRDPGAIDRFLAMLSEVSVLAGQAEAIGVTVVFLAADSPPKD